MLSKFFRQYIECSHLFSRSGLAKFSISAFEISTDFDERWLIGKNSFLALICRLGAMKSIDKQQSSNENSPSANIKDFYKM